MPFFILIIKGKGKKFKGEFMQKQVKKFLGVVALLFAITACSTNSGEKKEAKEEVKTESKEEAKNNRCMECYLFSCKRRSITNCG